jgi:four helix bundle protein
VAELPHAESFGDLRVYQKSRQLAGEIFRLTGYFPRAETYSLTDQVRRSSRSIGAQIAEAWAKRRYERHFVSKLTDADGERQETLHWIEIAEDCGYLKPEQTKSLKSLCDEIGRMLGSMIGKSHLFCGTPPHTAREPISDYFIDREVTDH